MAAKGKINITTDTMCTVSVNTQGLGNEQCHLWHSQSQNACNKKCTWWNELPEENTQHTVSEQSEMTDLTTHNTKFTIKFAWTASTHNFS
jgi:hypothetical protein